MRKEFLFGAFCCLLVQSTMMVEGQSLNDTIKLQTIQVIASKIPGKRHETRSSIDSLSIAMSSTIRLSELVLQNTPIFIKEYGRGAMATASFRGTAPSHTKVIWNGIELNSPMLGMVDFSMIPVYFTESVNILHGSSSLSESSGALGGTILLDNQASWKEKMAVRLLSGYGSFGTVDAFGQLSFGNKKMWSKSAIYLNSSKNDFSFLNKLNADIDPATGKYRYPIGINKNADYKNFGFLQEVYFKTSEKKVISLKTWMQHNERSIPQLLTDERNDAANINRQFENAVRSVFELKNMNAKSRSSFRSSLNVQQSSYRMENNINGNSNQIVIDAEAKYITSGNRYSYRYQFNPSCTFSSELTFNYLWVKTESRLPSLQSLGYDRTRLENSAYASLEKQWNFRLTSTFSLREEMDDLKHKGLLPLVRLSWKPFESKSLQITTSASRNVHRPSLNDLYYIPGGNPLLKSEKSSQYDFGMTNDFVMGTARITTGLSLFSSHTSDWIIWLPTFQGYWEPKNIQLVQSKGLEANVGWNGQYGAIRSQMNAHYAYTKTSNQSEGSPGYGKQLPYIPLHSANLTARLSGLGFNVAWIWNYYSKRYTTTANSEETVTDYMYPYFMNNVQLGHEIRLKAGKLQIDFKINNLFNEDYRTVLQRPMPGRNYQLVFTYAI